MRTWAPGRRGFVSLQRNYTTWAEHQCARKWCCRKKPVPPSMAGHLLETVSSSIAFNAGDNEKLWLLFLSSLCLRNCPYHALLFSLVVAAPLILGYHCPFVRRLVDMRARRTGPWKRCECHLGVSALLMATSSWTLKGGRPCLRECALLIYFVSCIKIVF